MVPGAILLGLLFIAIPPLTEEQVTRLRAADPGRDHQEDAFVALLENARQWTAPPGDAPARQHADSVEVVENPDSYRGDLFRIRGGLELITRLKRPYDKVYEWCVRSPDDRLVIVYVASIVQVGSFQRGDQVELLGRFYKVMTMIDQTGRRREYAAFVGAQPSHVRAKAASRDAALLWFVGLPVVVLLIVFLLLLGYVRRRHRGPSPQPAGQWTDDSIADKGAPLPEDPAEALAELRKRAEAGD